jgi:hypothetical protein
VSRTPQGSADHRLRTAALEQSFLISAFPVRVVGHVSWLNVLYIITTDVRNVLPPSEQMPRSDVEWIIVILLRCLHHSHECDWLDRCIPWNPWHKLFPSCLVNPVHTTETQGLSTVFRPTRCWLPAATLYMKRIKLMRTRSTPCCSLRKSSCCRRNVKRAGCWVTVYDTQQSPRWCS